VIAAQGDWAVIKSGSPAGCIPAMTVRVTVSNGIARWMSSREKTIGCWAERQDNITLLTNNF
jgi:hypothetical protein